MILVVADASPVRYLIIIGFIDVSASTLRSDRRPQSRHRDETTESKNSTGGAGVDPQPAALGTVREPEKASELGLHRGESDAIALAIELHAFAVLLDDADARIVAGRKGVASVGTLGVLEAAAERGFLDLGEAIDLLSQTNFRIRPEALHDALSRDAVRRRNRQ